MLRSFNRSISNKLMLVVMATTFFALLAYGIVMLAFDLRAYHDTVVKDLVTQASIIAEVSAPALEFNDPVTAKENLELLRTRPAILRAAIYTAEGTQFATYKSSVDLISLWPEAANVANSYTIDGNRISVWQNIVKNDQHLGSVFIRARYEANTRLFDYTVVLVCVMIASLGLASFIAFWLRGAVTKPIFAVTDVARQVMQSRDFSLRAEKFTEDEIGVLVDAFNDMLSEVERRAKALEASNRSLEREMTERQAAEDALRLADRRKDEFLATLAHELRNPLAPLLNSLNILRSPQQDPVVHDRAQSVMERQLKQMVRLVDDLLDVSRITTGKLAISKVCIDIQSVIRDAVESSSTFIKERGHELTLDIPEEPVYIKADPIRLAQVFSNLLNNSAKYTNPGGSIQFAASVINDGVLFTITDNGIGIEPDMLNNIFDMFTQVDQTLERAQAGLGVGLALARHLVELHGGQLQVSSPGTGCGSTFSLRLALAEPPASASTRTSQSTDSSGQRRRVLLVDDNVDFVSTLKILLSTMGHDIRIAHDGVTAQSVAREFQPEFAFLDIGMPGMNGYDLARYLRQSPETANAILVAVTGWGQDKDRQLSKSAGFNHHLVKPVELSQVMEIIEAGVTPPNDPAAENRA
jgi:signal transduction histidine kinase/ActR/RegA family two-component response regulator